MNYKLIIWVSVVIVLLSSVTGWALSLDNHFQADLKQIKKLEEAYVVRVIDGDTIETAAGQTIRLIGVDTPETKHPSKPVEYYGKKAAQFTTRQLEEETIYLEYDVQKRDKYNRLLAYVFTANGTLFNARLLHDGYANLLTIPPNVKYVDLFKQLAKEAREEERGLWKKEQQKPKTEWPLVSWQNAGKYIGQKVIIKGKIVNTYDAGEVIFLNFAENYNETFTAVIFFSDKYKFEVEPEEFYLNKSVKVRGKVKEYKGAPEIIVENPAQIKILN